MFDVQFGRNLSLDYVKKNYAYNWFYGAVTRSKGTYGLDLTKEETAEIKKSIWGRKYNETSTVKGSGIDIEIEMKRKEIEMKMSKKKRVANNKEGIIREKELKKITKLDENYSIFREKDGMAFWNKDLVWIVEKGEIPDGYIVINKDGNLYDNIIENLKLIKREDLDKKLRRKMGVEKIFYEDTGHIKRAKCLPGWSPPNKNNTPK